VANLRLARALAVFAVVVLVLVVRAKIGALASRGGSIPKN
jgi:hypothetical protein